MPVYEEVLYSTVPLKHSSHIYIYIIYISHVTHVIVWSEFFRFKFHFPVFVHLGFPLTIETCHLATSHLGTVWALLLSSLGPSISRTLRGPRTSGRDRTKTRIRNPEDPSDSRQNKNGYCGRPCEDLKDIEKVKGQTEKCAMSKACQRLVKVPCRTQKMLACI